MVKAHFLNVGKGSTTIIEFGSGRKAMMDVDDSRSLADEDLDEIAEMTGVKKVYSQLEAMGRHPAARALVEKEYKVPLTDPIAYYKDVVGGGQLFRFILSHPDMDHMSGLRRLYNEVGFLNLWDTNNKKKMDDWGGSPYDENDWNFYQRLRNGSSVTVVRPHRGDLNHFWQEDAIDVLSPSQALCEHAEKCGEYDHLSYALNIDHAGCKILLGGETTPEAWEEILKTCGPQRLKAHVLLAPHHGGKHNFHREAMEAVSPQLVIVSVHVGGDYAYAEYAALRSKPKILATKWWGNIRLEVDDSGHGTYDTEFKRD